MNGRIRRVEWLKCSRYSSERASALAVQSKPDRAKVYARSKVEEPVYQRPKVVLVGTGEDEALGEPASLQANDCNAHTLPENINATPLIPPPLAVFPPLCSLKRQKFVAHSLSNFGKDSQKPQQAKVTALNTVKLKPEIGIVDPLVRVCKVKNNATFLDLWDACVKEQSSRKGTVEQIKRRLKKDVWDATFSFTAAVELNEAAQASELILDSVFSQTRSGSPTSSPLEAAGLKSKVPISKRAFRKFGADRFLTVRNDFAHRFRLPRVFTALKRRWEYLHLSSYDIHGRHNECIRSTSVYFATALKADGGVSGEIPLLKLLNWHIPFTPSNLQMNLSTYCKRLKLMFSMTMQGPKLEKYMITAADDVYATSGTGKSVLMTDGCSTLSFGLMRTISERLSLPQVPCVIQARFGNAKGLWCIDPNTLPNDFRFFTPQIPMPYDHHYSNAPWIAIRDSQRKWELPEPDRAHQCAVEVRQWSKPCRPAKLNPQLIRILEHHGVSIKVFADLLERQLERFESYLMCNMVVLLSSSLEAKREFAQRLSTLNLEFALDTKHLLEGGTADVNNSVMKLLGSTIEQLVNDGHIRVAPTGMIDGRSLSSVAVSKLAITCYNLYLTYATRLATFQKLTVADSRSLLVIPDPTGTLNANEVFVHVSDVGVLSGDVVVGRNPAYLPWDLQKVVAVFKSELEVYTNVVIFSTKLDKEGAGRSLADVLSGGDYDGDLVWVCWDANIISGCRKKVTPPLADSNEKGLAGHALLSKALSPSPLGSLPLSSFTPEQLPQKLYEFECNTLQQKWLGVVSVLHSYVSDERELDDSFALDLGMLAGALVDEATSGRALSESFSSLLLDEYGRQRTPHWVYAQELIKFGDRKRKTEAYICDFSQNPYKFKWHMESIRYENSGLSKFSRFIDPIVMKQKQRDDRLHRLLVLLNTPKARRSRRARGVLMEIVLEVLESKRFINSILKFLLTESR